MASFDRRSFVRNKKYYQNHPKFSSSSDFKPFPLDQTTTTTGNNTEYLIIRQGVLDNDMFYHFNLSVRQPDTTDYINFR